MRVEAQPWPADNSNSSFYKGWANYVSQVFTELLRSDC